MMRPATLRATARPFVIVQQLKNGVQWEPHLPDNRMSFGVGDWVRAVSDALITANLQGLGVVAVDFDGNELLLAHPAGPGAM